MFIEKESQQERILRILQEANGRYVDGMYFLQFPNPITQFHTRIFELQKQGYKIEGRFIPGRNWKEYRLLAKVEQGVLL